MTQVQRPGEKGGEGGDGAPEGRDAYPGLKVQPKGSAQAEDKAKRGSFLQRLCSCFSTTDDRPPIAGGMGSLPLFPGQGPASRREFDEQRKLDVAAGRKRTLLPPTIPANAGKKCLVLDLDETLVHSSFQPTAVFDFQIKVRSKAYTMMFTWRSALV